MNVKTLPDPGDTDHTWYELTGTDNGTGCQFDGDVFGVAGDGSLVNSECCPLVESDWETIAVRNSIPCRGE